MRIAVIDKDKIVLKNAENVKLDGRKGAIVKVLVCGLCGSDIVKFVHKIAHDGTVLGHEIVAEIVDINSDTNFKCGDVIVTSHHIHVEIAFIASTEMFLCVNILNLPIFDLVDFLNMFI